MSRRASIALELEPLSGAERDALARIFWKSFAQLAAELLLDDDAPEEGDRLGVEGHGKISA